MTLSILIPARNEMFLAKTIENILENIEADTEIIAVLDGKLADPPIKQHPRVTVVILPEAVGQRKATNIACRLSRAKYVMKVDAHCSFDKGFDRKMIKAFKKVGDNVTMVPVMRNLHAFDWVCKKCGNRWYQGPTPEYCCSDSKGKVKNDKCDSKEFYRDIKWIGKKSPQSTSYSFDAEPHFQYFGSYKKKQKGDLVETMSLQGSCFMSTRKNYWKLELSDEKAGSWGNQGIEVALATWLSGGRVLCNKRTWYAHMFRTQGGDFGFPYKNKGKDVRITKNYIKEKFWKKKHPKQIRPVSWVVERFKPEHWKSEDIKALKEAEKEKGIIYYTDNKLNIKLARKCRDRIKKARLPIVSTSLKPIDLGKNFVVKGKRGYLTLFRQILKALEELDTKYVFFCEHDVLYDESHFDFTPKKDNVYYYNNNVWKWNGKKAVSYDSRWLSQLCCNRNLAIKHYKKKIELEKKGIKKRFEPGTRKGIDNFKTEMWESSKPNVDIRHGGNLTGVSRFKPEEFKTKPKNFVDSEGVPYWDGFLNRLIF